MKRFLIVFIALVSLIAMGSPAMADRGVANQGNSAAGKGSHNGNHKPDFGMTDPNCRGVRASLFVIANGGLGLLDMKLHGDALTDFITMFFDFGAASPDCIIFRPLPD
jgi:hypothetical protein